MKVGDKVRSIWACVDEGIGVIRAKYRGHYLASFSGWIRHCEQSDLVLVDSQKEDDLLRLQEMEKALTKELDEISKQIEQIGKE